MKPKEIPLEPSKFYHVYNRGNNRENIFKNNGNYEYFLNKFNEHLSEYIDVYAFCLLPNHFHYLIHVKENNNIDRLPAVISQKFSNFFNAYSKAINKQHNRVGSLFQRPFKRIEVDTTKYLVNLVCYIHANPQIHGIIDDFRMYPWSSYNSILQNEPSSHIKEQVLEWFDNRENYIAQHSKKFDLNKVLDFL